MHKVLVLALVVCACKGDNKQQSETRNPPSQPSTTPPEPSPTPDPKPAVAADTSKGSCKVTGKGASTFEQVSPHGGAPMLTIGHWISPASRQQWGMEEGGLILNCLGEHARISLTSKNLPMKPGTYKLGGNDAVIHSMSELKIGGEGVSLMKSDGTVEITAFDASRIAGTATFAASTLPDKGKAELVVTFDLQCSGLDGCK